MWEAVLRVPPLLAMDSILNNSFLSYFHFLHFYRYSDTSLSWAHYFEWLFLLSSCFVAAVVIFLLGKRQLLTVYSQLISLLSILISYYMNTTFTMPDTNKILDPSNRTVEYPGVIRHSLQTCLQHLVCQIAAAFIFCKSWEYRRNFQPEGRVVAYSCVFMSFVFPVFTQAMDQRLDVVFFWSQTIALIIPLLILSNDAYNMMSSLCSAVRRTYTVIKLTIGAIGIQGFLENHWVRLHVPKVLRIFFTSRFLVQVGYVFWVTVQEEMGKQGHANYVGIEILNNVGYQVVVRSCDNVVSLLGLTSIVSFLAHYIGTFMAFCIGSTEDDDKNMGTVSAILFFILALQTGLTGLDPDKRLSRLCKNLYLLGTAITHFVHSMVHPLLMSLSASRNMHVQRHIRALAMCAFLITFPSCLLVYLWSIHKVNTWLMAVTAFSLEVIIKVIVSLMVYFLFMWDAYRDKFWESLDDYVYYIQSTGNTIEFLFGIFLFCNGGWILLFESGGTIRAVMMCIHAYFNIWVQAKEGWKVFMKRKTAVDKINSLPMASREQLRTLNDVCAICYQELQTARITFCNHYFHGVCLRKWLYIQDNCPLCYKLIYHPTKEDNSMEDEDNANQNNINDGFIPPQPRNHQE